MFRAVLFAAALLAACSTVPAATPDAPLVHGETPGHSCVEDGAARFIGHSRSEATGAAILAASNAAVIRWAPPGVMLTMDYRADRVTVTLDTANKITKIRCG
jgi:hypothetical protein